MAILRYHCDIDHDSGGICMRTVILSPKYQVIIPKEIREQLQWRPGQVFDVVQRGERIELVPQQPAKSLRGLLRGIETSVPRDRDRS